MSHSDFDFEPVRGLPAHLPAGEQMLWQGAPHWRVVARRVFRLPLVLAYFAITAAWSVGTAVQAGETGAISVVGLLLPPLLASALLLALSVAIARTTVYTLTSQRIVMRFGVAIDMTVNVAFKCIASADVRRYHNGSGDICLTLVPGEKVGYAVMWPHVRPWRIGRAQPMLRALPDVSPVADALGAALARSGELSARAAACAQDVSSHSPHIDVPLAVGGAT